MRLGVDVIFHAVVNIPDVVVTHTPGGAETVKKEVADRLTAEMAIKYGKQVSIKAEILEDSSEPTD
jgi:hypothetical protein